MVLKAQKPMTLYCDNSGVVANSKPRSHKRGKHIKWRYHLLREIVHRGAIIVRKIDIADNLANQFTKNLVTKLFERHLEGMWLHNMLHLL